MNSLKIKGSGQNSNYETKVPQKGENVKYSISDTNGAPLITEQLNDYGLDAGREVSFSLTKN